MTKPSSLLSCSSLAAIVALSISTVANAALPGFYTGAQAGWGNTHYGSKDVAGVTSANINDVKLAGRLFGGYQFNNNWAFELGYTQFSKSRFSHIQPGNATGSIREYSIDALGKGILPLNDGFGLFGELGMAYINAKAAGDFNGANYRFNPAMGAGVSYDVNSNVPIFAAWNHVQKVGGNIPSTDLFSVGIAYHFG